MIKNVKHISEQETESLSQQSKAEFLKSRIEGAIKTAQRQRSNNRRKASAIKIATILFSSTATILLGLQITGLNPQFKNIAFVFGSLVTLLTALEPFFNFRALWVEHETALWKFYRLKDKVEYYLKGINPELISTKKLDEFQIEYQNIWDELSASWINYRKQNQT
jgi:hypothetical protein